MLKVVREEVHSIAALLHALPPVLHKVPQREERVIADGDPVLRRPGFHGDQDYASVELLLIDLDTSKRSITHMNNAAGEEAEPKAESTGLIC